MRTPSANPAPNSRFKSRLGKRLKRLFILGGGGGLLVVAVLASPLGRVFDRAVSAHFHRINQRREMHRLTALDGVECNLLYSSMALAGRFVSPEASDTVWHYLYGKGEDLWLDSSYLQASPVVQRSWRSLKPGQSHAFSFQQSEDWRLSYALNPFSLHRDEHEVLLWQRLEFSTNGKVKTTLNYGLGKIQVPDALIHVLHPQPFTVYSKWKI